MGTRGFVVVDVFGEAPFGGNPVAVVLDAEDLPDATLAAIASWTNLSETTFLLPPTHPDADYRVRILTPSEELPFAGHPTLGTAHAWLGNGGRPRRDDVIVQECGIGLVEVRTGPEGLSFQAPTRRRSGPVDTATLHRACAALGIDPTEVVDAAWCDNGPPWIGLLLRHAAAVLAIQPGDLQGLYLGVVGPHGEASAAESGASWEVRAFFPQGNSTVEDPVTGSLNAALAQWLLESGRADTPYRVAQGARLGRTGRVRVERAPTGGPVWIGGATSTRVVGAIEI